MRSARASDWWRRLYGRTYPTRLDKLEFHDVVGLGSGTIDFTGGMTAICGANGVGKTTLLQAIRFALTDDQSANWGHLGARFSTARLTAEITNGDGRCTASTAFTPFSRTFAPAPPVLKVEHVAPALESGRVVDFLAAVTNFEEFLEAHSPRRLTPAELMSRSFVVGRDYEHCDVYEIDDYDTVFPYFRVKAGNVAYGSEAMGQGELAIHIALWRLERMQPGSILLLEEPESHIPPRSQLALLDVVAKTSVERGIWTIVATHSAQILENVPRAHVRLLYRTDNAVEFLRDPTDDVVNRSVGVSTVPAALLSVEDATARDVVLSILGLVAPDLLAATETRIAGSNGSIDALLKSFPPDLKYKVIGVYDGDQRASANERGDPKVFLPTNGNPEVILKEVAMAATAELAATLGRGSDVLRFHLAELQGVDLHDWVVDLSHRLGIEPFALVSATIKVWRTTEPGISLSEAFATDIRAALAAGQS